MKLHHLLIAFLVLATPVLAKPDFTLPADAPEVAPGVYHLGYAFHQNKLVHGYAVFHHRNGHDKGGDSGDETSTCFAFIARGANWRTAEPWLMNPANSEGLDESALFSVTASSIQKWEDAAGDDIFGAGTQTSDVLVVDESSPDGKNEVVFGTIDSPGAIAVTIVWGQFGGPPGQRQLVEWDQVYDEEFAWSLTGEAGKMDYENIATHELGHAAGLGHPSDSCAEETMYRFASAGETKKRDLHAGDIAGIASLYG